MNYTKSFYPSSHLEFFSKKILIRIQRIRGFKILIQAVFRIRDILILIQIRIPGSVHLITDPDPAPDPARFVSGYKETDKNKLVF
jgi:hypothetical protein